MLQSSEAFCCHSPSKGRQAGGDLHVDTLTHKQTVDNCMLTTNVEGAMSSDISARNNDIKSKASAPQASMKHSSFEAQVAEDVFSSVEGHFGI